MRREHGVAIIEYTILTGLIGLVLMVAIANVADQILDIWNDLMEDLDTIDDCVADCDIVCPESDEDGEGDEPINCNGGNGGNGNGGNGGDGNGCDHPPPPLPI